MNLLLSKSLGLGVDRSNYQAIKCKVRNRLFFIYIFKYELNLAIFAGGGVNFFDIQRSRVGLDTEAFKEEVIGLSSRALV